MKIVVIDDQQSNLDFFKTALKNDFVVEGHTNPELAINSIYNEKPSLVLVDCVMPKISGHDVFKKIKSFHSNLPIIMISGYRIEENLIKSMDDLIDDFIFKPVCSEELIARINNKIAKYENKQNLTSIEDLYDDILFNDFEEKVTIDGNEYDLKGKEYRLLKYMVTNKNQLISRDEIFSKVWNDTFVSSATLDTHLCQLRKKLDKHGDRLITRKNSGFIYSKELNQ